MSKSPYIAGNCNIGREEITHRKNVGLIGLALTFLLLALLIMVGASRWWRLLIFLPASLSAAGFIQARLHFCAGFARLGVYNFGALGEKHEVFEEPSKSRDRKRGNQIALYSVLIGIATSLICVLL